QEGSEPRHRHRQEAVSAVRGRADRRADPPRRALLRCDDLARVRRRHVPVLPRRRHPRGAAALRAGGGRAVRRGVGRLGRHAGWAPSPAGGGGGERVLPGNSAAVKLLDAQQPAQKAWPTRTNSTRRTQEETMFRRKALAWLAAASAVVAVALAAPPARAADP